MTERERFEEWANPQGFRLGLIHPDSNQYRDDATHAAWTTWQAALAAERAKILALVEETRNDARATGDTEYAGAANWLLDQLKAKIMGMI